MLKRELVTFSLLSLLSLPCWSEEKPNTESAITVLSPEEVEAQQTSFFQEMLNNADPQARALALEGLIELGQQTNIDAALTQALSDPSNDVLRQAIEWTFKIKNKANQKAAEEALKRWLQSEDSAERSIGYALLFEYITSPYQWLQPIAQQGAHEAQAEARQKLLAQGGRIAWPVIEAGLNDPQQQPAYQDALEALSHFSDPCATSWAVAHLSDEQLGMEARLLFARLQNSKEVTQAEKALRKKYAQSEDYETRLPIAAALNLRSGPEEELSRTLHAGITPRYQNKQGRLIAWQGLKKVRNLAQLEKIKPILLGNLSDDEAALAYDWLRSWGQEKAEPQIIQILQEAASGDRRGLRLNALAVLADLQHRGSSSIFEAGMSEGQTEIRIAAAKGLAKIAQKGDEARLGQFLRKDPDTNIKYELVKGLGRIATSDAVGPIQFVVTNSNKDLKLAAIEALKNIQSPQATQSISILKRDPDLDVRFEAWKALLQLQGEVVLKEFASSAVTWLSSKQIEILGENAKIPEKALILIAEKGELGQRLAAIRALEARNALSALQNLAQTAQHPDSDAQALARVASKQKEAAVDLYRQALQQESAAMRTSACNAIGHYGQNEDRASLELQTDEPALQTAIALAQLRLQHRFEPKNAKKKRKAR